MPRRHKTSVSGWSEGLRTIGAFPARPAGISLFEYLQKKDQHLIIGSLDDKVPGKIGDRPFMRISGR